MKLVFLALGSNLKNPIKQIKKGIKLIKKIPNSKVELISSLYESIPMGKIKQPKFLNLVLSIRTKMHVEKFLFYIQNIEYLQEKKKMKKWGPRTLDIDIILWGGKNIKKSNLVIPHYDMQNRDFVLYPLLEIAPNIKLPSGKEVRNFTRKVPNRLKILKTIKFC
ncbi:2-amino-4-hydroxy-6-hydroxymethyldihydropteridine diphosphokinase [bacterium endosymbiont of Pedicinus badii]|uniref:2-amino-4-hydroxy-6- hydroxymethyldihydropteridine diphosphokinase n=1 Tax=bacterium endosymbiont of Pedicinus badii TaxID=1719126 RepID=UPI0009B96F3D|nr:2-amino-4-hydroxy-6-hydroxymethyldihydropteridine diphosphokinase [bacterium endosymbiont of Pedicinus badii]OQM34239.1 hypothetical protein AOQ89_02805 [bacterium endosymbiont of Pedicinus badii]